MWGGQGPIWRDQRAQIDGFEVFESSEGKGGWRRDRHGRWAGSGMACGGHRRSRISGVLLEGTAEAF